MDRSSTDSDSSSPGPALENSFGALLLGTYFALMLYGLLVYQSYKYFRKYSKDGIVNKAFVAILLVLETLHTTVCMHFCYMYLIVYATNEDARKVGIWSLQLYPLLTGLCVCVSQCFYARRVYLISKKYRILVAIAVILSLAALGFLTAATAIAYIVAKEHKFVYDIWINRTSYATSVVADSITTGLLIFNLKRLHTGIKRTDLLLDRLAAYAINTGLLIGVANMLLFILSFFGKNVQTAFLGIGIPATKLYANSVLTVLNARQSLAEKDTAPVSTHLEFITLSHVANTTAQTRVNSQQPWHASSENSQGDDGSPTSGTTSEVKTATLTNDPEDA
ncbi:hypothetical protein PYCCODRAFT_1472514 [Trametes coccinea BRFM310]|uniref:DUF6534 domain-containing protein n=1 Tax=Trametes coccinea (strain BRFM310) TaxID=1353009 RepID=A0A1Y2I7I5_TRAC3|nr:hypothetical protein PYCCODRAFT_1472514 [Trametes coccinea BRFM310]